MSSTATRVPAHVKRVVIIAVEKSALVHIDDNRTSVDTLYSKYSTVLCVAESTVEDGYKHALAAVSPRSLHTKCTTMKPTQL